MRLKPTAGAIADSDRYFTLESVAECEVKLKGSRFIAHTSSAKDKQEAEAFVRILLKKYHNATHVCFAYRIGSGDGSVFRYSDAGEPAGTAGKPILEAIDSRTLCFVVCAVARYFGGVKLGTGGLSRAYSHAAGAALDSAKKVEKWITTPIRIAFSYEWTGAVRAVLSKYQCVAEHTDYSERTEIVVQVVKSKASVLKQALTDATAGKIKIT